MHDDGDRSATPRSGLPTPSLTLPCVGVGTLQAFSSHALIGPLIDGPTDGLIDGLTGTVQPSSKLPLPLTLGRHTWLTRAAVSSTGPARTGLRHSRCQVFDIPRSHP